MFKKNNLLLIKGNIKKNDHEKLKDENNILKEEIIGLKLIINLFIIEKKNRKKEKQNDNNEDNEEEVMNNDELEEYLSDLEESYKSCLEDEDELEHYINIFKIGLFLHFMNKISESILFFIINKETYKNHNNFKLCKVYVSIKSEISKYLDIKSEAENKEGLIKVEINNIFVFCKELINSSIFRKKVIEPLEEVSYLDYGEIFEEDINKIKNINFKMFYILNKYKIY